MPHREKVFSSFRAVKGCVWSAVFHRRPVGWKGFLLDPYRMMFGTLPIGTWQHVTYIAYAWSCVVPDAGPVSWIGGHSEQDREWDGNDILPSKRSRWILLNMDMYHVYSFVWVLPKRHGHFLFLMLGTNLDEKAWPRSFEDHWIDKKYFCDSYQATPTLDP